MMVKPLQISASKSQLVLGIAKVVQIDEKLGGKLLT